MGKKPNKHKHVHDHKKRIIKLEKAIEYSKPKAGPKKGQPTCLVSIASLEYLKKEHNASNKNKGAVPRRVINLAVKDAQAYNVEARHKGMKQWQAA